MATRILASRYSLVLLLAFTAGGADLSTDDKVSKDKLLRFAGEVARGHEFRRLIGHGLVFALIPDGFDQTVPGGWTITIAPDKLASNPECRDFVWVLTPPYRGYNQRYLTGSYEITSWQAVQMSPRKFNFVLNCMDYEIEAARVRTALWPYSYSKQQQDDALSKLGTSPQARGKLWIDKSKISRAALAINGLNYGSIDWIQFHVEIQFP